MKRDSEAQLGKALREIDLVHYVYRPPDPKTGAGVSNWKPCDFMVWYDDPTPIDPGGLPCGNVGPSAAWFEAKDTDALTIWNLRELRQSQVAGIRDAARVYLPYWVAIYWRRHREWTISDGRKLLEKAATELGKPYVAGVPCSIARETLIGLGIQSTPHQLTSTLKQILLGEI